MVPRMHTGWRKILHFVLAVALIAAPLVPAFGMPHHVAQKQVAEVLDSHDHGAHAHIAPEASTDTATAQANCVQHDGCDGSCCATCAQYFTANPGAAPDSSPMHSIQSPVVAALHPTLYVASLIRPPQAV